MGRLYIANATKQTQIVFYRLDIDKNGTQSMRPRPAKQSPPIQRGKQIPIGGDLSADQIGLIIDQLAKVGLMGENELNHMPNTVVPYIFNVDRPVAAESIRRALAHNNGILMNQGKARREAAALNAGAAIQAGALQIGDQPHAVEASIEQEDVVADESKIEEGWRIPPTLDEVPDKIRSKRERRTN